MLLPVTGVPFIFLHFFLHVEPNITPKKVSKKIYKPFKLVIEYI